MAAFLIPGVKLLDRFRLRGKFILIAALVLVPMTHLAYGLIRAARETGDVAERERWGVVYLAPFRGVAMHLAEGKEVQSGFGDLDAQATALGKVLGTESSWSKFRQRRIALGPNFRGREAFRELQDHWGVVADNSGLVLDPALDSFYVMDAVVVKGLDMARVLLEIREEASEAIGKRQLTPESRFKLASSLDALSALENGLAVNLRDDKAGSNPRVKAALAVPLQALNKAIQSYQSFLKEQVLDSPQVRGSVAEITAENAKAVQALDAFTDQGFKVLEGLLAGREKVEAGKSARAMGEVGLVVILAIYLLASLFVGIRGPLSDLVAGMGSVGEGDLTCSVRTNRRDEFGAVGKAFNRQVHQFREMVTGLKELATSVAGASAELANGSQDMSRRTEQQASNLGHAAASMEELSASVASSLKNAQGAAESAGRTRQVAEEGGGAIEALVQAVSGVDQANRRIGEIIGVVDEIAFQTNLLALNAAVEAARAGEQGRGFAVVAAEVRNLAKRSSEAAKEIKGLILDSIQRGKEGSTLAIETRGTIHHVVSQVVGVTDQISTISRTAREQAGGISEVNTAVSQIESAVQQNAALVEQLAASADSLNQMSQELAEMVDRFRVDEDGARRSQGPNRSRLSLH